MAKIVYLSAKQTYKTSFEPEYKQERIDMRGANG
jgi:hypothetical protein